MRKIRFRGKRADNNEWVYGIYEETPTCCLNPPLAGANIRTDSSMLYPIDSGTLGQFTGLYDKNGVPVYEGDKVMYDYEWTLPTEIGIITWNKNNASFQIKGHIPSSSMKRLDTMKVIGNIFDDLIKDGIVEKVSDEDE